MFDALTHRPARRQWSTLFLVGSLALHAAGAMALIIAAMWKIERLVPDRQPVEIRSGRVAFTDPGPEPAPGPPPPRPDRQRRRPPPVPVQPAVTASPPIEPVASDGAGGAEPIEPGDGDGDGDGGGGGTGTCVGDGCGGGGGAVAAVADRCGDGAVTGAEACDDGNAAAGDGCSATCQREPRRVTAGVKVIESLRIAGETRIQPPADVQTQMARSGIGRTRGVLRVCLDASGGVEEARFLRGTGFAGYDQRLLGAVSAWRYRPYSVNGQAVAVCGTVEFVYVQQ